MTRPHLIYTYSIFIKGHLWQINKGPNFLIKDHLCTSNKDLDTLLQIFKQGLHYLVKDQIIHSILGRNFSNKGHSFNNKGRKYSNKDLSFNIKGRKANSKDLNLNNRSRNQKVPQVLSGKKFFVVVCRWKFKLNPGV